MSNPTADNTREELLNRVFNLGVQAQKGGTPAAVVELRKRVVKKNLVTLEELIQSEITKAQELSFQAGRQSIIGELELFKEENNYINKLSIERFIEAKRQEIKEGK